MIFLSVVIYFTATACGSNSVNNSKRAFPGAEGAGKNTTGGRGGIVYTVTNLNDDGKGSLRDGVQKHGARNIVFAISGCIGLKSSLDINNDNITIAGQTAPGPGICLLNYGVKVAANNVIIRYIRVRPGDSARVELDAMKGRDQKNIIIDHCSFSWAVDEVCSFYDNENLTIQYCIISESLNNSVHHKGIHGYGGIWGGLKSTFHHNLLAHHNSRNPRLNGSRYLKHPELEKAEIVNNVVYNWKSKCMYAGEAGNYIIQGNAFIPGPATSKFASKQFLEPYKPYSNYNISGNYFDKREDITKNNYLGIEIDEADRDSIILDANIKVSDYKVVDALQSMDEVLNSAGASKVRDSIDLRIVSEVEQRKSTFGVNGVIDSQNDVGGYPVFKSVIGPIDSDKDGMPDEWELKHEGLNPHNADDANQYLLNKDYTNLEVYMNSLISFH